MKATFGEYLTRRIPLAPPRRNLREMKNLEWIFIALRVLEVPVVLVMAWLHHPISMDGMIVLAGLLAVCSIIDGFLNYKIKGTSAQWRLGIAMLAADTLFFWGGIFLFVHDFHTAGYAYFAIVIIQAAVRFGLVGSVIMGVVFALGLWGAMIFRLLVHDVRFSTSGYAFWAILMALIALAVGLLARESQRDRQLAEDLVKRGVLLAERHRIARDLHDTVLKTLQGLAMEAYALRRHHISSDGDEKLKYIELVCRRSSQEIRDVVYELRRDEREDGIASQLSRILDTWSRDTAISSALTISGNDLQLPLMSSYNLRCVLSEALDNVRSHASASRVEVFLDMMPTDLQVVIQDDGCGMGTVTTDVYHFAHEGKFGILGMKERIEQIGGQFSIEDGSGMRLVMKIPLTPSYE